MAGESDTPKKARRRKAMSPEARENQMISLATNLAEQKLLDGSASTPIIVHYLKLGSMKEQKELEMMNEQMELIKAKTEALQSAKQVEALYKDAMEAMKKYSGGGGSDGGDTNH